MKVYVIKNKDGKILSWDYTVGRHFFDHYNLASLSNFSTFSNPKKAEYLNKKYKDTEIVELNLLTSIELADYTKQVRKEVCEEIRKYIPKCSGMDMVIILDDTHTLNTILDQIQGEKKC